LARAAVEIATSGEGRTRTSGVRTTLDRNRWISEGLVVLAEDGVAAVRVESLAKRLDVTKGSFYWHFADRPELLAAMLEEWRRSTLTAVVESVWGKPANARQKLQRLWRICFSGRIDNPGGALEAALRQWSLADARVAELMATVDAERIAFVARIYAELAVDDPEAYARLFYCYVVGRNMAATRVNLPDPRNDETTLAVLQLADD
jgi:AcrR family transcriptional regulator